MIQALDYIGLGWIVDLMLWIIGFDAMKDPGNTTDAKGKKVLDLFL